MTAALPIWPINLEQRPVIRFAVARSGPWIGRQRFLLANLWAVHFYNYHAQLDMAGHALAIRPNTVSLTPPGAPVTYHWPRPASHPCVHIRLAEHGDDDGGLRIAALLDLGNEFASLQREFLQAVSWLPTQRTRAEVRIWDILWRLMTRQSPDPKLPATMHPAVQHAIEWIELHLSQPMRVATLAREVGLSHNQLIRLFHQVVGMTIVRYIRKRRVERAVHLLTQTTLPIKAVAAEVGVIDLHAFNKMMRQEVGRSPTKVRLAADAGVMPGGRASDHQAY